MKIITRRTFLKTTGKAAIAAAAVPGLPWGWYNLARAGQPRYFEAEFGITDSLCQKVLAAALALELDLIVLFGHNAVDVALGALKRLAGKLVLDSEPLAT